MSADIGPGDWVEFIGRPAGYTNFDWPSPFTLGAIYRVTEVGRRCVDAAGVEWPALRVAGMRLVSPHGNPCSAPVAAFRPIYRPKSEIIESLKQPLTEDA